MPPSQLDDDGMGRGGGGAPRSGVRGRGWMTPVGDGGGGCAGLVLMGGWGGSEDLNGD